MRRVLSEHNLVVIVFILALIIFVFAHRDTRQMEMMYMDKGNAVSALSTPHQPITAKDQSHPRQAVIPNP